ncbi:hemolysin family protein [Kineothrix sp. MB12-C1]|uniref:hemolysin family protein n=1 Tax=Kineothrix sp. MB12-C1 TaxID=3070215 RepID=UPI0027D279BB|nr:hemolysin family protein [Kineothrix sp. MB12-C1]WMC91798.1 hemolysin family protein [Kineothrix sp. MB12-C1]
MDSDPVARTIISQLLFLVFLTLVNAFFAGAEMAVVSVNKNKIKRLASAGNKKAALILHLSENSTSFLSTIQVAITFAGFFSSASAATGISQVLAGRMAEMAIPYSGTLAVVIVTLILSYFTLVFGELVPKRVALQKAEGFSLFCVTPIYYVSIVMSPFIKLLSLSTNGFLHLIGMSSASLEEEVSEEEIKSLLETGQETGVFNDIEKEMITSIFSFDDKKAKEVMTPRQDMVAIDISKFRDEYLDTILQSKRSRIPVYDKNMDTIIGILSVKDFMIKAKEQSFTNVNIRELLQKPYFVPENQKIDKLFQEMQKSKIHMAVLVDEYGGVSGLVTLEDLIEEIVGDIWEEYEEADTGIVELSSDTYHIPGNTLLYDLNEELHLHIVSNCDTLSGYLIELLGYIPEEMHLPLTIKTPEAIFSVTQLKDRVITSATAEIINKQKENES